MHIVIFVVINLYQINKTDGNNLGFLGSKEVIGDSRIHFLLQEVKRN